MDRDLTGKVALVTGSTRNIGRAIALKFAEHGADVVVNGRDRVAGEEVVGKIEGMGRKAVLDLANLFEYEEIKGLVDRTMERFGRIDILVPSGGGAVSLPWRPFEKFEPQEVMRDAVAHWISKAWVIRAALDYMIPQNYGKIINISTDAGRVPTVGESNIGAGAAATLMMTKVLARELGRYNIRVNAVCLSATTDAPLSIYSSERTQVSTSVGGGLRKRQLFPVSAFDVADCALYLAAPTGDAVTGQIFSVNGGLSPLG